MELPVIAAGVVVFLILLIMILRRAQQEEGRETPQKKEKKSKQPQQKPKQKRGRTSLKKGERPDETQEWTGIDTPAKDAQEVLEFLKGKDPVHLAKQQASISKQGRKKEKKVKEEVQSSEESTSEDASTDGFENVVKKKPSEKKKKKKPKVQIEDKLAAPKLFYKVLGPDGQPIKDEKKEKKKRERGERGDKGGEVGGEERKPRERPEGERKERKPREGGDVKHGEKREREKREGGSDAERPPKREVRRPITSPPNVKQEEAADLNDILNSITQDYKAKPEIRRVTSVFSRIPRTIVVQILSKLEARDLVALSAVNHYFMGTARRDTLWRDLLLRDFELKDAGKARNFRAAYRAEYKKKFSRKINRKNEDMPQEEEKDTKVEVAKGGGGKERKEKKGVDDSATEKAKE